MRSYRMSENVLNFYVCLQFLNCGGCGGPTDRAYEPGGVISAVLCPKLDITEKKKTTEVQGGNISHVSAV